MDAAFTRLERLAHEADGVDGLRELCGGAASWLGADAFNYGLRQTSSFVHPELVFLSSFPEALMQRYREADHVQVDAVVDYAYRHVRPATWDEAWGQYGTATTRARVLPLFAAYGYTTGCVVPVHGVCGQLSILGLGARADSGFDERFQRCRPQALYLGCLVHETAVRVAHVADQKLPTLTERERQCLAWTAEGKTAWETAQILGIAERTVSFHLQNACVKLEVSNRQQAVARAIALGLMATAIQDLPEPK